MLNKKPETRPAPQQSTETRDVPEELEHEIDRQIGDLVPQKARGEVVRRLTTIMFSEVFSGPIAHPRHLRAYEEIVPGSADRIISMAEERNQHHIEMDKKIADAEIRDRRLGMICGAALFGLLIASALVCALVTENALIAGAFLTAAVVGGVGLFIKGRSG